MHYNNIIEGKCQFAMRIIQPDNEYLLSYKFSVWQFVLSFGVIIKMIWLAGCNYDCDRIPLNRNTNMKSDILWSSLRL